MASSSLPEVQPFGGQWSKSSSLQQDNSNVDGGGGGNSSSIKSAGILPSVLLPAAFGAPSSVFHHGPQQFLQSGAFLPREEWIEQKVASRDHRHNGGCRLLSYFGFPFCYRTNCNTICEDLSGIFNLETTIIGKVVSEAFH